ncbi:MAG TPA: Pr6Pr family membrane protein [Microcella sp.]|nr:Pr6Pr family membrane protein [Microcella sp.]
MLSSRTVRLARAALGAGGLAILAADIAGTLRATGGIDLGNYLGQFTILSVAFTSILMLLGAARGRDGRVGVHLRAMALTGLGVAAVLHATLLGGTAGPSGELVNQLLHTVFPALAVVEWAVVRSSRPVRWVTPLIGLAFPVAFLAITLARGALVDWYPYDFVDPRVQGGYVGLVGSLAIVLVAFLTVGAVVTAVAMLRDRVRSRRIVR